MKKKIFILIGILIVIGVIVGGLVLTHKKEETTSKKQNVDFKYIGLFEKRKTELNNYVFTSYADFKDAFESNELTEKDFEKNNYAVVSIPYDICSESNLTPVGYTITGNDILVNIEYESTCGVCAPEYMYYVLKVDKSMTTANVTFDFKAIKSEDCDPNIAYKPLIYLYPTAETEVTVKLGYPESLTTTYPKYDNEWKVLAKTNGELTDVSGRTYYGLYWEGLNNIKENYEDGFVVSIEETISFLEEKLAILGLNEREANEFIIYWLPKLEVSEYNLIRFESMDVINNAMPLDITPTPDTIIRILMVYKPLDKKIDIKEQALTTPTRTGFTVVEWGGSLIK